MSSSNAREREFKGDGEEESGESFASGFLVGGGWVCVTRVRGVQGFEGEGGGSERFSKLYL